MEIWRKDGGDLRSGENYDGDLEGDLEKIMMEIWRKIMLEIWRKF